ncbi:SCD1_2 [Blepharisma stoltei]|uniref:UDENN domain-containing protein n=1 Tax=Blepharisma stoltei TaxID=1481888 RepID=A0AAU9JLZ4_9CILI|nr:unnamed protein product [Blepharisma stoltei]
MEELFREDSPPGIRLIDSIAILGLTLKSLRNMFLEGKQSGTPEVIVQLPPTSNTVTTGQINMIFTSQTISLEKTQGMPKYFSTTITNEKGIFTHFHCLITYEKINPHIIEMSKNRLYKPKFFDFIPREYPSPPNNFEDYYVPIALCLMTHSNYIDLFRNILESLYLHTLDILQNENKEISRLLSSTEFMKTCCFLLNDTIIPPPDVQINLHIGKDQIAIPIEIYSRLSHNESCVAVLIDLIDIRNVIEFWESILLNKHAFLLSCNEYLLYLVLEAFKILLFPMKWTLSYIPVLAEGGVDVLGIPTPVLIGINSDHISAEEAIEADDSATILDIDSNILYTSEKSVLCDCVKANISRKIQLAKAYYYVNSDRLSTFRMTSLEENLEDKLFVKTARKLLETWDDTERDQIFVSLIRHAFFNEFIVGISKFSDFTYLDTQDNNWKIHKQLFLEKVKNCTSKCTMTNFWGLFLDSVTFNQFLDYYEKFDESLLDQFLNILESIRKEDYKIFTNKKCYTLDLQCEITSKQFYEGIEKKLSSFDPSDSAQKFAKNSCLEMLNEIKEIFAYYHMHYENQYFSGIPLKKTRSLLAGSPISTIEASFADVYYGEFGIIQMIQTLIQPIMKKKDFRNFCTSEEIIMDNIMYDIKVSSQWEPVVVKFLYLLKKDKKYTNFQQLAELCMHINLLETERLPRHHACKIIEKLYTEDPNNLIPFSESHGKLKQLAEKYKRSRRSMPFEARPSTVENSVQTNPSIYNHRSTESSSKNRKSRSTERSKTLGSTISLIERKGKRKKTDQSSKKLNNY